MDCVPVDHVDGDASLSFLPSKPLIERLKECLIFCPNDGRRFGSATVSTLALLAGLVGSEGVSASLDL